MNFQELGLTLQREREAKGLTIEAVMEATKISRINLIALESGDSSTLPHPVYTKGFIRSYARLLGLDSDELSMVVDREYQDEEIEVEDVSYDVSPSAVRAFHDMDAPAKRKKRSVWPSILIFIALALAGVLVVLNLNTGEDKPAPATPPAAEQQADPAEQQADPAEQSAEEPPPVPSGEQVPADETPEPSPEAEATAPASDPAPVPAPDPVPEPAVQPEADDTAAEQPVAAASEAEDDQAQEGIHYDHVLIIRATTDKGCWIGLWKGDEPNMARDFVLKKGEPLRLMFNNPRRIRIGNVAGVEVTYNGKPYPLEKNKSNIQTLVFGAD
ncbi:MAG: DUF4115 domain-containing protein [Desulfovibrionaceae bacterium]|nr:DUF4115 domain-containing protein [Desulfovibrionaceae bacterium]